MLLKADHGHVERHTRAASPGTLYRKPFQVGTALLLVGDELVAVDNGRGLGRYFAVFFEPIFIFLGVLSDFICGHVMLVTRWGTADSSDGVSWLMMVAWNLRPKAQAGGEDSKSFGIHEADETGREDEGLKCPKSGELFVRSSC